MKRVQKRQSQLRNTWFGAASQPVKIEEGMPQILKDSLLELEAWSKANEKDAQRDTIRFWMLKIPAIIASASAGLFAFFGWEGVNIIAGAIASLCVLIDGLNPGGTLRNIHLRAFHDLRNLQHDMVTRWRVASLEEMENKSNFLAQLLDEVQVERRRIAAYLRDAETLLGEKMGN